MEKMEEKDKENLEKDRNRSGYGDPGHMARKENWEAKVGQKEAHNAMDVDKLATSRKIAPKEKEKAIGMAPKPERVTSVERKDT